MQGYDIITLSDTEAAIKILDPENKRIPRFFIYDKYDENLIPLRKKLRQYGLSSEEKETLELNILVIEDRIERNFQRV